MLPVFTAEEMRRLDRRATAELGISGATLMEAAGAGAAGEIRAAFGPLRKKKVVVLCGKGNNGGDGFVVARHLARGGASVRVFLEAAALPDKFPVIDWVREDGQHAAADPAAATAHHALPRRAGGGHLVGV